MMSKSKLVIIGLCTAIPIAWFLGRSGRVIEVVEKIVEVKIPPEPLPRNLVSYRSRMDVAKLFNGIQTTSELQSTAGSLASIERKDPEAYQVAFEIDLRIPKANTTLDELATLNPELPKALPGLGAMMQDARVSDFYHLLYDLKQKQVQTNLTRLESALSRHNFYDCETILEIEHPESAQKVMLMQGEMDVVSDGSDGDRMPELSAYPYDTPHFQATTSYGWKKVTATPNPLASKLQADLAKAQERYKVSGLTRGENASLEYKINNYPLKIQELAARSFLIAKEDPFVVIPLSMHNYEDANEFTPKVGDYAVVVYENKLVPAIVGDYGPAMKMGEASLRMAQFLNSRADSYNRPVSDLTVTYLIFPGSRDLPKSQPNLATWHTRCTELLGKIGGIGDGFELHQWEDRLPRS